MRRPGAVYDGWGRYARQDESFAHAAENFSRGRPRAPIKGGDIQEHEQQAHIGMGMRRARDDEG